MIVSEHEPMKAGTVTLYVTKLCAALITILLLGFFSALTSYYLENPSPPWGDERTFRVEAVQVAAETVLKSILMPGLDQSSWLMSAAAMSLPLTFLLLIISIFWFFFRNSFQKFMIRRYGGHVVLSGSSESASLILSWMKPALWVVPGPISLADRAAVPKHCAMITGHLSHPAIQEQSGVLQAHQVMLVSDDGAHNVQTALTMLKRFEELEIESWRCSLYVAAQSARLVDELERRLEIPPDAEVHVFQPQTLGVRKLFLDRPTERFRFCGAEPVTRAVVIGFGGWGEEILKALLLEGHSVAPERIDITVVDRDAAYLEQVFTENHHNPEMLPSIRWIPLDVTHYTAFGRWLDQTVELDSPPCVWFICLGKGELSYSTALRLETCLKERLAHIPPVYYFQPSHPGQSATSWHGNAEIGFLHPFGSVHDSLEEELVLQQQRDTLARRIHENYLALCLQGGCRLGDRPALQEWGRLPQTFKLENRSQADHHQYKIRQIGCRLNPVTAAQPFKFTPDQLEHLAAAEHSRWSTSRLLSGWRYGPVRDDVNKLHPDIIPYEQLSERVKDLDRDAIRHLPALFGEAGLAIVPEMLIGIGIGASLPAEQARRDKICAEALLHARMNQPNRHPVLFVRMGVKEEREIGCAWYRAGGTFHVVIEEPLHLQLNHSDPSDRPDIVELARHADKTLAIGTAAPGITLTTHRLNLAGGILVIEELSEKSGETTDVL